MGRFNNIGLVLAWSSAFCFSISDICTRLVLGYVTVWGLLFLRGIIGLVLIFCLARRLKLKLWSERGPFLMLIGLCGFLSSCFTISSMGEIPLYQAIVILFLYPAFALILSVALVGERACLIDVILVIVAFLGCVLLIWPDGGAAGVDTQKAGTGLKWGHLYGLAGSFLYGLNIALVRRLGPSGHGLLPMFYYCFWALLGSLPLGFLVFGAGFSFDKAFDLGFGALVALLGFSSQLLCFAALKWLPAYKVGTIGMAEVFVAALASYFIFNDPLSLRSILGGSIIVLAALRIGRSKVKS